MAPMVLVVGLAAAGAVAYALGGKTANAKALPPPTHRPKKKAPGVTDTTEAAIIAAMKSPQALKMLVDKVARTGDPVKLWNLGRTILLNSQGKPAMQAAAAAVLAKAVIMAVKSGDASPLVATALANGDADILAKAAISAAVLAPEIADQLKRLAAQLAKAKKTPPNPTPGPGTSKDDVNAQKAAQAATQVVADAIKATQQVENDPPSAPVPNVPPTPTTVKPVVTTLPETVITAEAPTGPKKDAYLLTSYLESLGSARDHTLRGKEDKKQVSAGQKALGLNADGIYGPGTASKIAQLGVVPVPPFYWTKGKAPAQKKAYKAVIALMSKQVTDDDWSPALKGVDVS